MGVYAEQMTRQTIRVTSPDEQLAASLTGRSRLDVTFAPGRYPRYTERALEEQSRQLLEALFDAQRNAHFTAMSRAQDREVSDEDPPADNRAKRYRELVSKAVATGDSRSGLVRVGNRGTTEWKVRIADGALQRLTQEEFAAELGGALKAMLRELFMRRARIRHEVYDVPVGNPGSRTSESAMAGG